MSMPKDEEILARCDIPGPPPINMSRRQHQEAVLSAIHREVRRGATLDHAIKVATGRKPMAKKAHRAPLGAMGVSVLLGAALAAGFAHSYAPNTVSAITAAGPGEITPISGTETVLLVGEDARSGNDDSGSPDDIPGSRTDMIALMSLSSDPKQAVVVSLPRDLKVDRPRCEGFDVDSKEYTGQDHLNEPGVKINSIYEIGGPKCLTKTVEKTTGVKINRYVQVDFEAFRSAVDAVGGVKVESDGPIQDQVLGDIIEGPGTHQLNGDKALDYVRARHVVGTGMSDFDRMQRQRDFVFSLVDRIRETGGVSNPTTALSLARGVAPMLTLDNIDPTSALSLLKTLLDTPEESLHMITVPIQGEDEYGNLIMDEALAKAIFTQIISGKPISGTPRETAPNSIEAKISTEFPEPISIMADAKRMSEAERIANELAQYGITSIIEQSEDTAPKETMISFDSKSADHAVSLAALLPNTRLDPEEKDFTLTMGEDAGYVMIQRRAESGTAVIPVNGAKASDVVPMDLDMLARPR